MPAANRTRSLTLRLLRTGRTPDRAFSDNFAPGGERELAQSAQGAIEGATLYAGQIYSNSPPWLSFLNEMGVELPADMFTGGAGAILFVPVQGRIVGVCFGQIHIALNEDAFERQFGLKVALNAVPRDQLRTLDLATPDAVTFQKRVQASRDSDLGAFGVDMLRDLARVAGGTPRDKAFASFVAGKDSLSLTCKLNPADLVAKCDQAMTMYRQTTYKTEFAWVDNMRVISERDDIARLDTKLFEAIGDMRRGETSELHMAPPEIVDYTEGSALHYNGFGSHGTEFHSLAIADYIAELNRCGFASDIADIKQNHKIKARAEGDDEFNERWRVYDCLVFETIIGTGVNTLYCILFAGKWYRVEKKFKARVDAFYDSIEKVALIGSTSCRNERELIAKLDGDRADLLMLDQTKINPADARYANLEPCDFLSNAGDFIHLKDGHSSGSISHLWSQGVVSAEAFVSDEDFRKKLRKVVKDRRKGFEAHLPTAGQKPKRAEFRVVYGIMRKPYANGSLDLPFFSKVSLQVAIERIRQLEIPVALELIEKPASDDDDDEEVAEA